MERKSVLEQKAKVKSHEGRPSSTYCCGSKMISCARRNPICCDKVTEFLCSACLLCIFCPLSIVWCCIKLPCKIGCCAVKHAKNWACCVSEKKIYASYSSFSDIDSDYLEEGSKSKMTHRANSRKEKDLQQAGV